MSAAGVDEAVERIRADHELAAAAVADGPDALGAFDLTDDEAGAVIDALRQDVEAALGEVSGFDLAPFGSIPLTNLIGVGRQFGSGGPGTVTSGWIERPGPGPGSTYKGWIEI